MDLLLKDKVALITGGSSGIGFAATQRLLAEGCKVVMCALDETRGSRCVTELSKTYADNIAFISCDVTQSANCEQAINATVSLFGKLDIVVNSAGVYRVHQIEDVDDALFDWMMDCNLKGTYFICKYAVMQFRKQQHGGAIINVSSAAGLKGGYESTVYCASKGGVEIFSKALALDVAKDNIRVNCVSPADINTPMLEKDMAREKDPDAYLRKMISTYPLGRIGKPDEVAVVIALLASPLSDFTTGTSVSMDGGGGAGW